MRFIAVVAVVAAVPLGLSLAFGPANFLNTVNRRGRYIVVLIGLIGVYGAVMGQIPNPNPLIFKNKPIVRPDLKMK